MIPYEYFVNEYTLNIFTDASIVKKTIDADGKKIDFFIGSPGVLCYIGDQLVDEYHTVLIDCTNNQSEITAIQYGVIRGLSIAAMNGAIKNINIFSDSKLCIFSLREWIFNWVKNMNNGILYSSSGSKVANQLHFISVIDTVIQGNRDIRFYHVRGHFNSNSFKDRIKFKNSFMKENYFDSYIDERLIDFFISANYLVDKITRDELHEQYKNRLPGDGYLEKIIRKRSVEQDIIFNWNSYIRSLDLKKYKKLIGGI